MFRLSISLLAVILSAAIAAPTVAARLSASATTTSSSSRTAAKDVAAEHAGRYGDGTVSVSAGVAVMDFAVTVGDVLSGQSLYLIVLVAFGSLGIFLITAHSADFFARRYKEKWRTCPGCAESIKAQAEICRYCLNRIPDPFPEALSFPAALSAEVCTVRTVLGGAARRERPSPVQGS